MKNTYVFFIVVMMFLLAPSCQKENMTEFQSDSENTQEQLRQQRFNTNELELTALKGQSQSSKFCIQVEDEGTAELGEHYFPNYPGSGLMDSEDAPGMLFGWGAKPFSVELAEGVEGTMASMVTGVRYTGNGNHAGATHYKLIHYFVSDDGDEFWTDDRAVCNPFTPGEEIDWDCIVNDQMSVAYGTGKFCDAYGKIFNHGVIDLAANEVVFHIKGRVCSDCMSE